MKPTGFYVYIAASLRRTLYTGMTRDISTRLQQHKAAWVAGFGAKYRTNRLVWCEIAESFEAAREREAQIKRWRRAKKLKLIGNEIHSGWTSAIGLGNCLLPQDE